VVTDGKNSGKHLDLAIYAKDGCVYQASHIDEPPMTIVNGRRPRKLVWKQIHADLTHIPSSGYAEVAKTIDHLNELHGQCWTNVYKGHEGELSREFLDQIHQRASKRLPEDPDIHPGIPT
jgi:hypothetical protein